VRPEAGGHRALDHSPEITVELVRPVSSAGRRRAPRQAPPLADPAYHLSHRLRNALAPGRSHAAQGGQRTPGLLARSPNPSFCRRRLGDLCVTYEINVYCDQANAMGATLPRLHRNILDVFNEHGVQIMTPAYVADTPQPKVVRGSSGSRRRRSPHQRRRACEAAKPRLTPEPWPFRQPIGPKSNYPASGFGVLFSKVSACASHVAYPPCMREGWNRHLRSWRGGRECGRGNSASPSALVCGCYDEPYIERSRRRHENDRF